MRAERFAIIALILLSTFLFAVAITSLMDSIILRRELAEKSRHEEIFRQAFFRTSREMKELKDATVWHLDQCPQFSQPNQIENKSNEQKSNQ